MVADVPLSKLEEASARGDVSWISADQEVRSLDNSVPNPADNTSHVEVTTGASKILPKDTTSQIGSGVAYGGAGNGVGIAILDSGITPCDNAEFVGYQWKQSSGTLGMQLVRLLSAQLHGSVELEREPRTRFIVRFPCP